jgi:uncharacterized damage-inducible protein DinB
MTTEMGTDEISLLRTFLNRCRGTLRSQCSGLDADQLGQTLAPSDLTLGGMLKHLAFVEQWWFRVVLLGLDEDGIWADVDWEADGDWDWHSWADHTPAELDALLAAEIVRSDAAIARTLASGGLDALAVRKVHGGKTVTLRWVLLHMIEEYARHSGHADLIRESIDGAKNL